jgi:hypothetical protein
LVTDVFPCENGHAQERSLFGPLLKSVKANDLWIEDRNFCTRDFLCEIDNRGAFFVTREHLGLKFEILGALRECGRTATGSVAQQRVKVVDQQGHAHLFRRVRIKLKQATRDGATIVHLLTNLPRRVSGKRVADLYLKRWTVGVSSEGHMNPVGESPTEVTSSSLVAWEAPWREIKTVKPSDTMLSWSMRKTPGCNVQ